MSAVAAVTVLAAAGLVAWRTFGGDVSPYTLSLPEAVSGEPNLAWTWTDGSEVESVVPVSEDLIITATANGDLTALDGSGDEVWSVDAPGVEGVWADDGSNVMLTGHESDKVVAYSVDDGDRLWEADAGSYVDVGKDYLLVLREDSVVRLDLQDGHEEWSEPADGEAAALGDDVIFIRGDTLHRVDVEDGDQTWSSSLEADGNPEGGYTSVVMTEDFVVFGSDEGAEAFGLDHGEALWEAEPGADGVSIGRAADDSVYIVEDDYSDDSLTVQIYDADGRVASLRSNDGLFAAAAFESGGENYLFDYFGGTVYNTSDYERVGREHDGQVALAQGGLYELDNGHLRFYEYGEDDAKWAVDGDFSEDDDVLTGITAGFRQVFVVEDEELFAYE